MPTLLLLATCFTLCDAMAPPDLKQKLEDQLDALRKCEAQQCRMAEER